VSRYLIEVGYTADAFAVLIKNPQDRIEKVRPALEQAGGTIETAYFAFGDHDLVLIVEMADNVSAAALSMAVTASGAVRQFHTTPLLTIAEGVQAMRKASDSEYEPPTSYVPDWR
jgi:uncharacterized protein with GYD domain